MCTYYCFFRRTELTKLKVNDVNLKEGFITISGKNSKNKKTDNVTIPNALLPLLQKHLENAKQNDYLFSRINFEAGKTQMPPKKFLMNGQNLEKHIKYKININDIL